MYISTFSTFTHNNTLNKSTNGESSKTKKNIFSDNRVEKKSIHSLEKEQLPINYISKNSPFSTQLILQTSNEKLANITQNYSNIKQTKNAQVAYEENNHISFSFYKADTTLSQTSHYNSSPLEQVIQNKKVSIYRENERYYQITA